MDQINELLRAELGQLFISNVHIKDGLATITKVKCAPNLRNAIVGISVIPEGVSGTALSEIRKHNAFFNKELKKKLNIKFIPKFVWEIDKQERYALEIDKVFDQIKKEEAENAKDDSFVPYVEPTRDGE